MRLLITSAALLLSAAAAQAGSYSTTSGHGSSTPVVSSPTQCTGILVGGSGYCIGGKVYHL